MNAPVFVKIDKYEKVHSIISRVKKRVEDARGVLRKIEALKHEEERELASWKEEFAKVEAKVSYIEDALARQGDKQ